MARPSWSIFGAFFVLFYNVSHWLLALVFLVERHYQDDLVGGVLFLALLHLKFPGSGLRQFFGFASSGWRDFAADFMLWPTISDFFKPWCVSYAASATTPSTSGRWESAWSSSFASTLPPPSR
jgi:hypothetical protein